MAPPKYNLVARNCQDNAEVWNMKGRRIERVAYREMVKMIGKA